MATDIRKLVGTDKLVIGSDRTLTLLRAGALKTVVMAANCPAQVRDEALRLAGTTVAVERLEQDNEELGIMCKKPFRIAMLGIKV